MLTGRGHQVWQGQEYYRYLLWTLVGLLVIYILTIHWESNS